MPPAGEITNERVIVAPSPGLPRYARKDGKRALAKTGNGGPQQ